MSENSYCFLKDLIEEKEETIRASSHDEQGMTLRDYFAAKALNALIQGYATSYGSPTSHVGEIVDESYRYADAMMEARKK